jgi:hypothetical protein
MKLLSTILSRFNKIEEENQDQKDSLIEIGREQFKKLQELGVKIPIAVL